MSHLHQTRTHAISAGPWRGKRFLRGPLSTAVGVTEPSECGSPERRRQPIHPYPTPSMDSTPDAHDVLRGVFARSDPAKIAAALNIGRRQLYKWSEPAEVGVTNAGMNPVERTAQLLRCTQDAVLMQWLCAQCGGFFIRNPDTVPAGVLMQQVSKITSEFALFLNTVTSSSRDNIITPEESHEMRGRWDDMKRVTESFVAASENGTYGAAAPAAVPAATG
jgi:hypothetical protein